MVKSAVLIIGYNRIDSLKRLLSSVQNAIYNNEEVDLIFSIDYSGTDIVSDYVKSIEWSHGNIIYRLFDERQGLKKHILSCGTFLRDYEFLVILEDDVIVAPLYYIYAKEAANFYKKDDRIAGISLYAYEYNMNSKLPFSPERTEHDIYFMQYAQSWGQIWMKNSFTAFLEWLKTDNIVYTDTTPSFVNSWPDMSSWLKLHIKYCVDNDKYFVYPYNSLSTCFSDPGEHINYKSTLQQVNLYRRNQYHDFKFVDFDDCDVKYDVFFERIIRNKDILVDIYGTKTNLYSKKRYILSTNNLDYYITEKYALDMKPHELNFILNIKGDGLYLYDTTRKADNKYKHSSLFYRYGYYFYQEPQEIYKIYNVLKEMIITKIKRKIFRK